MSTSFYCDECGAALTTQAICCPVCNHRIDVADSALSSPADNKPLYTQPMPTFQPFKALDTNTVLNSRYIILEKVGEGGFGLVYKARDQQRRGRLVAVKQINLSALTPKEMMEATDSYNREIKLLPRLHHRNLPGFHDHFTDSAHWYVVMDFIDGITLEEYVQKLRRKRLPLRQVQEIGLVLSDVLHYLHTQKPPIIFRDIKPSNIMFTRSGRYYLIDFGIARQYTPGKNRDTGPLGSPGYAAPEQYGKTQTNERTDIYGLAATLQMLITGKDPGDLADDALARKRLAKIPERLRTLLEQMLQADATQRPASMLEVKYRLEHSVPEGFFRSWKRRILAVGRWIFHRNFFFWMLTFCMAFTLVIAQNTQTLQYIFLLLALLLGFFLRCLTEEIEMNMKPLRLTELLSIFRVALQHATFPLFGLTFFAWLYLLGYQETFALGAAFLYVMYYLGIGIAGIGFCLFSLFRLLKEFFCIYQHRSSHEKTAYRSPLQQQMRNP